MPQSLFCAQRWRKTGGSTRKAHLYQPHSLILPVLAQITPVILTYNEAANIGRTLERLAWAREVVVVDSLSTDDTVAIAGRFPNARVVQRAFDSHARQWKFAVEETGIASDWVLRLDADYMLEPPLRDEIAALAPPADVAAYLIGFTYCMDGKKLRASLYPSLPVLFRRGRGSFVQDGHTEKLRIDGPVVPLSQRLLHDDRKTTERWLQSQSRYQAAEAEKLMSRPWSELSWADRLRCTRVLGPLAVAVHCLFVKGLLFDGRAGLLYTAQRVTADIILSMHLLRRDIAK
ncbi:MAG: glycosyltransferase family 2 protein [Proteobacteria bacterium]|nr:glycosyltransferase family 2 protein [Pseudomonadota bacterium]